jgi:hypothetical protein
MMFSQPPLIELARKLATVELHTCSHLIERLAPIH